MPFLAPLGLLLGGLTVPLVAMYFLKLRRHRVKVPSVLLWQQFQKAERLASPFERFRRSLLLLFQLLALLLLVLAASRPFLAADAPTTASIVLVLDVSASMGATDADPYDHRLAQAVARASERVSAMSATDEAMIVVAGPRTEVLVPFTSDRGALTAALDGLEPTEAEGSLRDGLVLAVSMARTRQNVDVAVFSDGGGPPVTDVPTGGATVSLVSVGRSDENTAITAVDLRRSPSSDLLRELFVTVEHLGRDDARGTVEVYLDDTLVGVRNEVLPPDVPVSVVFEIPGDRTGTLKIELSTPDDVLAADDTAWLTLSPVARRRVLLVGGDALTARALMADPRVALTRAPAGGATPALIDAADLVIVAEGNVPAGLEGRPHAVLGPLPGGLVTFGAEQRAPVVLGWRRTHPTLRFVEWDQVVIGRSSAVTDAGPLAPLVDGDQGPLVLAGESGGARVFQLAFDPLRSDLPMRVAWPVTLLNVVGWLSEGQASGDAEATLTTGMPFVRRVDEGVGLDDVAATGPDGASLDVAIADGLLRVRDTTRVGVYELRVGAARSSFTANLLSRSESDVAPRAELVFAEGAVAVAEASLGGRREIWRPLSLIGLLVLMVEWALFHRRRTG